MEYKTASDMAKQWNISDRRVRTLCRDGRIDGVIVANGTYLIPCDAAKPADGRYRHERIERIAVSENVAIEGYGQNAKFWLKWKDDVIATIDSAYRVTFTEPCYNEVVSSYTHGATEWSREEFERFLAERIVDPGRRDIEHLLRRMKLARYDVLEIAMQTRAVNAKDLLWVATSSDECMETAIDQVFRTIFVDRVDAEGDSLSTPEGNNIKRYGVYNGRYGIYKKRLNPLSTDVESEVAVYELAKRLGVDCCPAYRVDRDTMFSEFEYDWGEEYLVHMRHIVSADRDENEYINLMRARPEFQLDIVKMVALDFITRQDDRHLSNIAVKSSARGEAFYPLYDNGRSLFYEDTEETARRACENIELFATTWGSSGTYYDYVKQIADAGISFAKILDLDIGESELREILRNAGFSGYRLEYGSKWIAGTLEILRNL